MTSTLKKFLLPLALSTVLVSGTASALTPAEIKACKAMADSFGPKQSAVNRAVATRDTAAAEAEIAGEAWENAEALRNFSAESATEADAAKIAYDEAKQAFYNAELNAADLAQALERDVFNFNSRCATN